MLFLDRALYFDYSLFCVNQWHSFWFLQKFPRGGQGDPLSPFLFVIFIEAFSKMIAITINSGFISSFSVGASLFERVNISHLLFADDTLVFCGANLDQICSIKALLVCFEAISGLRVNMAKPVLVPVGDVDNVGDWLAFGLWNGFFASEIYRAPFGCLF
jgi:hypothetical protein